jgi:cysteine-S-conjugate beta-lyase
VTSPEFLLTTEQLRERSGVKWTFYPSDVLPAFVADMDFTVPEPVQAAIRGLVDRQDYGYGHMSNFEELARAFGDRMRERHGWDAPAELVEPLTDVVQGIVAAVNAFTEPGDGVIVQTPVYPPFLMALEWTGRRRIENPLVDEGGGFRVDLDWLHAVAAGARLLLLCNPHNPTGRVFSRAELDGIAEVAAEHDLIVVADEIHADLVYPGAVHVPFASLGEDVAGRTLTMTSATKAFNIAGTRCAVAHFGGEALRERFRRATPDHLLGRPGRFGVDATIAAWRAGQPWLDAVLAYLDQNRQRVADWVAREAPALGHHPPEGTYLAWLDCSRLDLDGTPPQQFFLEEARVALGNGVDFGEPGAACVRLNFGTSAEILDQILDRMSEAITTRI